MNWIASAWVLGLLGSLHCIGMCGPIAAAISLNKTRTEDRYFNALAYNSGRVLTYVILGLFFGLIGQSFLLAGYQQILSVFLGVVLLINVLFSTRFTNKLKQWSPYTQVMMKLHKALSGFLRNSGLKSAFAAGFLNGLLPCGLVYVALAGAAATANIFYGMLFMFLFGLGNSPSLFMIVFSADKISGETRFKLARVIPVFVFAMGVFLVLRGLNLGIPYVSPELGTANNHCTVVCKP